MLAASPWAGLVEAPPPPAWTGPARQVLLLGHDDERPGRKPKVQPQTAKRTRRPPDAGELLQLQRRAADAVRQVCPTWTLITPGSPQEALMRQVPPAWWWPHG